MTCSDKDGFKDWIVTRLLSRHFLWIYIHNYDTSKVGVYASSNKVFTRWRFTLLDFWIYIMLSRQTSNCLYSPKYGDGQVKIITQCWVLTECSYTGSLVTPENMDYIIISWLYIWLSWSSNKMFDSLFCCVSNLIELAIKLRHRALAHICSRLQCAIRS